MLVLKVILTAKLVLLIINISKFSLKLNVFLELSILVTFPYRHGFPASSFP